MSLSILVVSLLLAVTSAQRWASPGRFSQLHPPFPPSTLVSAKAAVIGGSVYLTAPNNFGAGGFLMEFQADNGNFRFPSTLPPLPDAYYDSDLEAVGGILVAFGGTTADHTDHGYYVVPSDSNPAWENITFGGDLPGARSGHTLTFAGGKLILYGGWTTGAYLSDCYFVETSDLGSPITVPWTRINPTLSPPPRNSHSAVVWGNQLIVFGGFFHDVTRGPVQCENPADGCVWYNDVWSLALSGPSANQWSLVAVTGADMPAKRSGHSAVVFHDHMFIHGGQRQTSPTTHDTTNDVWAFDLKARQWSVINPVGDGPVPRKYHTAAMIGNHMFVFGGVDNSSQPVTSILKFYPPWQGDAPTPVAAPPVYTTKVETGGLVAAVTFNMIFTIAIGVFLLWVSRKRRGSNI